MVLQRRSFGRRDPDEEPEEVAESPEQLRAPAAPQPVSRPQQPTQAQPGQYRQPSSAPAVPKELLSARPAMTHVVPRSPDQVARPAQAPLRPQQPSAQELADRQERIDYLKSLRQQESKSKKHSKKWLVITLLVLLLLAAAGAGAYWFLVRSPKTATTQNTAQQSTTKQSSTPAATDRRPAVNLKDYESTNYSLSLKYPSAWTVSDTTAKLTITSDQQSLPASGGQKVDGQIVVTVRHKQAALDEFKTGGANAVLDSKHLAYSQPAAGQRGSTYLSYLQYASTTTKGALDALYVTGNAGYQKGQAVPQADVIKVDPLITVSFAKCTGTCTATAPATSVDAAAWTASDLNKTVEDIIKSLAIS